MIPRRTIIPVFIPHLGCPHDCLFCNQHTVAGKDRAPTAEEVEKVILEGKRYAGEEATVAFYGGSFTCLEREEQKKYLQAAARQVHTIRLSTRPDGIDREELAFLGDFPVKEIELGGQSSDDEVLRILNRGHDFEATRRASALIREAEISLGLQMMTGLPGSSLQKEMKTAEDFIELKADFTRIYPTLVLPGTALERLYREKSFVPQTLEEATEETARLWQLFTAAGVTVIRMGLNETDTLRAETVAGPYHPAFGELVLSRVMRHRMEEALEKCGVEPGKRLAVMTEKGKESQVAGQKKTNIFYIKEKYGFKELRINPRKGDFEYSVTV